MSKAVDPRTRTISISGLAEVEQLARAGKTTEHGIYQPHSCWWEIITNNGDGTYEVQRVLATWSDTSVATDDRYDVRDAMDINGLTTIAEGRYVWGRLHATKDGELVVLFSISSDILAKITGSTSIDDNRWSYSWEEVEPNIDGTYTTKTGGRTSTSIDVAYNRIEANNSASGVQGNGVNVDNLPAGFDMVPIGDGAVVTITLEADCNGDVMPMFEAVNQTDGTC